MSETSPQNAPHTKRYGLASAAPVRISVIVVAQNNENYIRKALTSVLVQASDDVELIYVDNGSDDTTLEIAEATLQEHPRCRSAIISNPKNRGLGIARNQGIDLACGEFIMFLDGDDWYDQKALDRVKRTLDESDPDLIVFNHERFYPDGRAVPNQRTSVLQRPDPSSVAGRKELLLNLNVAWNKTYRASFIRDKQLSFGEGFYEDIDWNFKALLLAKKIATIPDILISYRQREGSILRSTDPRHFDVFQQWHEVLTFVRSNPSISAEYIDAIQRYAFRQVERVFEDPQRVPQHMKRDFFRSMSSLWKAFEKLSGPIDSQRHRKIDVMIRNDHYIMYRAFRFYVDRIQSALPAWLRRKNKSLKLFLYRNVMLRMPIRSNRILFDSYWSKKMDCNPYYIYRHLRTSHPQYEAYWSLNPDAPDRHPLGYKRIAPKSWHYYWIAATAKYFVSNANFPTELTKRRGTIHVQTKHGTPLKYMGLDIRKTRPTEMNWALLARRSSRWDYVISSNHYSTEIWREAFPYGYRVIETGYPRNDRLFSITDAEREEVRRKLNVPPGKKVALYAPTFRDWLPNHEQTMFMQQIFDPVSAVTALGDDYILLLRTHYFASDPASSEHPRVIDASTYVDANDICAISDLLISDYSSIIFDYANLKRPIVIYAPDFERYSVERGTYFDIRESPPGPVAEEQTALLDILKTRQWESAEARARLEDFHRRYCPFDDGRATERVIAAVFPSA